MFNPEEEEEDSKSYTQPTTILDVSQWEVEAFIICATVCCGDLVT